METKKLAVTVAAGAMALGAGLGVAGLASADPTPSPSASPSSSASASPSASPDTTNPDRPDGGWGHRGGGQGQSARFGDLASTLADKLGVSEAKVTEALRALWEENRPSGPPTSGTDRPDPAERDATLAKQLADKLGVSEAKVKAALDDLRTDRQTDRAAALKTRLDAAVKDGTLTQAEADAVTKAVEKGVIGGGRR